MTDPAGIFPTDVHRHIIGHLSHPEDDFGWTTEGLLLRTHYDPVLWFTQAQEIEPYLAELAEAGDVHRVGEAWQMTPQGFEKLTGPIKDEPGPQAPGDARPQPALVAIDVAARDRDPGRVDFEQKEVLPAELKVKRKFFKRGQ